MQYINIEKLRHLLMKTDEYSALAVEYGFHAEAAELADTVAATLQDTITTLQKLTEHAETTAEPNDYAAIRALCPSAKTPPTIAPLNPDTLPQKMAGALLGRFIGCTLGAPVEMWSVADMEALAAYQGMDFPPRDYWKMVDRPWHLRYGVDTIEKYTRDGIDGVPVDDDITYTILGLLIVEKYGYHFTTEDVGDIWKDLLPYACTAEDIALRNLNAGVPAKQAGELDNPYCLWIGADIRADGFGYAAAGNPTLAAKMGYYDAYLSHRRGGIYGEMYFAAAIAAAFTVTDPIEALKIAMAEIPATCTLHKDLQWAFEVGASFADYKEARAAVDARFAGMSPVHTNNNACLTVFGLMLGKGDFTETIANVVALGLDNDCTGATAGSIIGAIVGEKGIAPHWTKNFKNTVRTYLNGLPALPIDQVVTRFIKLAQNQPKH
jgi:ADP-ribosylglycohydrolase